MRVAEPPATALLALRRRRAARRGGGRGCGTADVPPRCAGRDLGPPAPRPGRRRSRGRRTRRGPARRARGRGVAGLAAALPRRGGGSGAAVVRDAARALGPRPGARWPTPSTGPCRSSARGRPRLRRARRRRGGLRARRRRHDRRVRGRLRHRRRGPPRRAQRRRAAPSPCSAAASTSTTRAGTPSLLDRIADHRARAQRVPARRTRPAKHRFLVRNRLIAALSSGTVVVEAGVRSGARNTATTAAALGKVVMAVPGPITSAMSVGCHDLLRTGAAMLAGSVAEILEAVGPVGEHLADHAGRPAPPHRRARRRGAPRARGAPPPGGAQHGAGRGRVRCAARPGPRAPARTGAHRPRRTM